jgi:hypothetical protein
MCFSAGASFAGGFVISAIGVASLRSVTSREQRVFSLIPIFFGLQQFAEGFVWLSLTGQAQALPLRFSTYYFLVMALVVWPSMIPLALVPLEKDRRRKRILKVFTVFGLILSTYYAFCLASYPVTPVIDHFHIRYANGFPQALSNPAFIVYLLVALLPLFISSVRHMKYFGALVFLSCAITAIFFKEFMTSVWCFFAALISAVIYWIVRDAKASQTTIIIRNCD